MFVRREELEIFLDGKGRKLLYGRRKTGKTFYARKKLENYKYFIVEVGGKWVFDPEKRRRYRTEEFLGFLPDMDKVILDEFHRLGEPLPSLIQSGEFPENFLLITSTLHYYLSSNLRSPLLGMVLEKKVGLISPKDLVKTLKPKNKREMELCFFYQEPVFIGRRIEEGLIAAEGFIPLLVGEILKEEEIAVTKRIEGVLEAVGNGENTVTEIAGYLHSKGIIPAPSAHLISKYVYLLEKIGLLEKIDIFKKKKGALRRLPSPLLDFYYFCKAKYGLGEVQLPLEFLKKVWERKVPQYAEWFFEKLFSEIFGLKPVKILKPEIDIALLRGRRLEIVGEVKWKDRVSKKELLEVEERLSKFDCKKILVVPEKGVLEGETDLEIWDVERIVEEIGKNS